MLANYAGIISFISQHNHITFAAANLLVAQRTVDLNARVHDFPKNNE